MVSHVPCTIEGTGIVHKEGGDSTERKNRDEGLRTDGIFAKNQGFAQRFDQVDRHSHNGSIKLTVIDQVLPFVE